MSDEEQFTAYGNAILGAAMGASIGVSDIFKVTSYAGLLEPFTLLILIFGFSLNCSLMASALRIGHAGLATLASFFFVALVLTLSSYYLYSFTADEHGGFTLKPNWPNFSSIGFLILTMLLWFGLTIGANLSTHEQDYRA